MAGKEAVVFVIDCNQSMIGYIELAKRAVRTLMVQKMLQSKQHELGVVLFGLPKEETLNQLNEKDPEDYEGVKEFGRLERGSVDMLRTLSRIDVPDPDNEEGKGDVLDAIVVGLHMIRMRTAKKKYARHVYVLTDAVTPVQDAAQLQDIVSMYVDPGVDCHLHFVGFGTMGDIKEEWDDAAEGGTMNVKEQNEMMLASMAAATQGTVVQAETIVNIMGESTIKTTNPVLSKVDLMVGTKLTVHCRHFKKTDATMKESLKKEAIGYAAGSGSANDGKVRVDRTYRDPEMPEVEVEFENQVKGFRYGQDYIPVNTLDEGSLKLPDEPSSMKTLGFVDASSVPRELYMDDTFVVMPEPGSSQSAGAIASLAKAMRNLNQVAVVRFVRRKGADPGLGFLMPDSTGVVAQERFLFQKLPFSEDIRDFTFPSFALKAPSSRKPSEEQKRVSTLLVEAMIIPESKREKRAMRGGLVLNPVRQGINGAKVARAMDPECEIPELLPSVKAGVSPEPQLLARAAPVFAEYARAFTFEKQERATTGKKRVTYFSDLTLAEPETGSSAGNDGDQAASKRSRTEASAEGMDTAQGMETTPGAEKVGSIDPVADFERIMAKARNADEGGASLAGLAVEQMQGVIHTLIRKGTTTALRLKAGSCLKALRRACVSHFMGQKYNDFLLEAKGRYEKGDHSDVWDMAVKEKDVWPVSTKEDASLAMTPQAAAKFMQATKVKEEEEEAEEDGGDDDDLDDMA